MLTPRFPGAADIWVVILVPTLTIALNTTMIEIDGLSLNLCRKVELEVE